MYQYDTTALQQNAREFSLSWTDAVSEHADSKLFLNEFFKVFNVNLRSYAIFERPIEDAVTRTKKFIDLFWPGMLLVEMKSASKNSPKEWQKALEQALNYCQNIEQHDRPQYILLCNFKTFHIYELEQGKREATAVKAKFIAEVALADLADNLHLFSFFAEFSEKLRKREEEVNAAAANKIAGIYEAIRKNNKKLPTAALATFLSRILFCLFAEDTGIFEADQFTKFIEENTGGNTLFEALNELFVVLNTKVSHREQGLSPVYNNFPFVNGGLFEGSIEVVFRNAPEIRTALLECAAFDWGAVSPVIFGSLFQAVLDDADRRTFGAHYTSEKNILRALDPLILDGLRLELKRAKNEETLKSFMLKLANFTALDPACGCGNFLIVLYRELRYIFIAAADKLATLRSTTSNAFAMDMAMDTGHIKLDNFYGIELDPTSAMIAEVALWMTMHQMNRHIEQEYNVEMKSIPLTETPQIVNKNALALDWKKLRNTPFSVIVGNPPFIGKQLQTKQQKDDLKEVFPGLQGVGNIDYVAGWYVKAAEYIQNSPIEVAFVSTNSITQGEQVGLLWNYLFAKFNVSITFAHRTFAWSNEAPGVAAVHVVIISFSQKKRKKSTIFLYDDIKGEPKKIEVKNINPYLVEGGNLAVSARRKPMCNVPEIYKGNQPTDGGFLLLDKEAYGNYKIQEPQGVKFIRNVVSGAEYLNGKERYCFWLHGVDPSDWKNCPILTQKIENCRLFRLDSTFADTRKLANSPHLFRDLKNPASFIVIPATSSENRKYIPFGFLDDRHIPLNSIYLIPDANLFHFGVLISEMHMAWTNFVCGRLESRIRYSKDIVYNNYPWPPRITAAQERAVELRAEEVLSVREKYTGVMSLAELYDPRRMPRDLEQAHHRLDKAVERCYRSTPFRDDAARVEYLFALYEEYLHQDMLITPPKQSRKRGGR